MRSRRHCGIHHLLLATFLLLASLALPPLVEAQTIDWTADTYGPRFSRGVQTQLGAFDFQEVDNVNLMNGSLGLAVPLGQEYPAGGRLAYQLVAHYGSNDTEARIRSKCTPPPCENFAADVPYAMSQAGRGWLVHLGRLLEPDTLEAWRALPLDARDQRHNFHEEWIFIEPDGAERHFHSTLHGEAASGAQYTRDGSYYRLTINTATSVSVEMPNGVAYHFSKAASWPDSAFNRDRWRLRLITDRSGNTITIDYQANSWTITDRYNRVQTVWWEADPWFGGRVDQVTVTAFGDTTATYNFTYGTAEFSRWNAFKTGRITSQHGLLDSISRPDLALYDFTYLRSPRQSLGFQLTAVALPGGGTLQYEYGALVLPSARDCDDPHHLRVAQDAVVRRKMIGGGGVLLQDTQYIRKVDNSPSVATDFCLADGDIGFIGRPKAELVVGVLNPYVAGRASLGLHYFSVFPISRIGPNFGAGSTNWKAEEFGQPFTRDLVDSDGRFLSTKFLDCGFDTWNPVDDLEVKAGQCTNKRSTFVFMHQDQTLCETLSDPETGGVSRDATWRCLGTNAHVLEQKTVFHDDGNRFTLDKFLDNDGFGHHRTRRLSGNIAPSGADETREERVAYNPLRGELKLKADGQIATNSTWSNLGPTQPWIIDAFVGRRIGKHRSDGLVFQRSEVICFAAQTGLINAIRIRADAAGDNDGKHDVFYRFVRDNSADPGMITEIRISGGDKQMLTPGVGCNMEPVAQFTTRREFQHGVLKRAFIVGGTTTLVDHRSVDRNTGLPVISWDSSGNVSTTLFYDSLGRLRSAARNAGQADEAIVYQLPGVNGWTNAPRITRTTSEGGTVLQREISILDELGREVRTQTLHPQSGEIAVVRRYRLDGALAFISTAQASGSLNANLGTTYVSDVFGRPVIETAADGQVSTTGYRGIGGKTVTLQVGAAETAGGVGLADSVTTTSFDRFGNTRMIVTPTHTTALNYNALDRLTWMGRGQQQRAYTYDGRGFLTQELVPEFGSGAGNDGWILHQEFDALGQPGVDVRPGSGNRYQYDVEGRLLRISDAAGNPRAWFVYGDSGTSNGRIVRSTRRNVWNIADSGGSLGDGGFGGVAEVLEVTYFDTHEPSGRLRHRTTVATPPFTPTVLPTVQFDQDWEHDALGRPQRIGYPLCSFQSNGACEGNNPRRVRNVTLDWGPGNVIRSVANTDTFAGPPVTAFGASMTYHPNGRIASIAHENGRTDWFAEDPNGLHRFGGLNLAGAAASPVANGLLNLGPYLYDGWGHITQIGNDRYIYDLNGRLAKAIQPATGGVTETYAYDIHDNFTRKGANVYSHNALTNRNQAGDLVYDGDGRITRSGPFKIVYDHIGAQISVVNNPNGVFDPCKRNTKLARPGGCFMNVYGADGRRVAVMETGGPHGLNIRFNWTIRDTDGRVLRTFSHIQSSVVTRVKDYIHAGRTLISSYGPAEAPVGDGVRHYHADHLGSTRVTTASNGALIGTPRHYAPFGGNANNDTIGERIVDWAGYEEDSNGITHNLQARSYFNGWGRFLSPDPARDGWNLYAYAHNDPIGMIDPMGLEACPTKDAQGGDCEFIETITTIADAPTIQEMSEAADRLLSEPISMHIRPLGPRSPTIRGRTDTDDRWEAYWLELNHQTYEDYIFYLEMLYGIEIPEEAHGNSVTWGHFARDVAETYNHRGSNTFHPYGSGHPTYRLVPAQNAGRWHDVRYSQQGKTREPAVREAQREARKNMVRMRATAVQRRNF